jgi:hypothetical protein
VRDTSDAADLPTDGGDVAAPAREPRQGAGSAWPLARREQHEERRGDIGDGGCRRWRDAASVRNSGHTPIFGGD